MGTRLVVACLICIGAAWNAPGVSAQIRGGMLDPAIDVPGEPFSYFWHPTDVIGAMGSPVASEVTPEGYVYTGFGELMFFTGNPPEPVNQRIKTLRRGYLPVIQYTVRSNDVDYLFTIFASDLGAGLEGLPVNFVRVELRNASRHERTAFLSSAFRTSPPTTRLGAPADYRFNQRFDLIDGKYAAGQTEFNPAWAYAFSPDSLQRDGRIVYLFSNVPAPQQASLSLGSTGFGVFRFFSGEVQGNPNPKHALTPVTPMGVVTYRIRLAPGQGETLVFKMPLAPVPAGSPEATLLRGADCGRELDKTERYWDELVAKRATFRFPETKVQDYILANTIFNLLAIDRFGDDHVMNVNKFQYHKFYPGNGANMIVALDYMGLTDIGKRCLLFYRKAQQSDGSLRNIQYRPKDPVVNMARESFEITAYGVWAWARHYLLTRDEAFLREVYPGVKAAIAWGKQMARKDPLGLMPPATVADDAMLANVRQTGMSLWVLIALQSAIRMAEAVGNPGDVADFTAEYQRYRKAFESHLAPQLAKSGGSIPPAMERTLEGNRWDDLLLLYPVPLFEPFDARITATIKDSRRVYAEGILGFGWQHAIARKGEWPNATHEGIRTVENDTYVFDDTMALHYWQTPNNAQNALVRGDAEDQEWAVRDLYALLLHTTSTHAPQEFNTVPWSTRDCKTNLLPDGAASAKTIELLRNMIVREYKNDLVLFSALSPSWFQPGKVISAIGAPTDFGPITLESRVGSALDYWDWQISLSGQFRTAPARVVIRIPWFYDVVKAMADGKPVAVEGGRVVLDPRTREVVLSGRVRPGTPAFDFESFVEAYKREYRDRYEEFRRTGVVRP